MTREKDDNLKAFLAEVKQRFDGLYDKVVKLLIDKYFVRRRPDTRRDSVPLKSKVLR